MFRRFPYIGWLLLSVILWSLAGYRSWQHSRRSSPEAMAKAVSTDLRHREAALGRLFRDSMIFQKMYSGNLSVAEVNKLAEEPFLIYAFEDNVLSFWNNNTVISTCGADTVSGRSGLFRDNGTYVKRCYHLSSGEGRRTIVVLFPVVYSYPFENEYLHSHFAAAEHIPINTRILSKPEKSSLPVSDRRGNILFHLQFPDQDVLKWSADVVMISAILLALLTTITFVNLVALALARQGKPGRGVSFLLCFILIPRILLYWLGRPFHLSELQLFSVDLYASSTLLPSLGDLLINCLCILWVLVYVLAKFPNLTLRRTTGKPLTGYVLAAVLTALLLASVFIPIDIIRSLVVDSKISFDVSHFYTVSVYTLVGLFAICMIAGCASFIVYIFNLQFAALLPKKGLKYLFLLGGGGLVFLISATTPVYEYYAFGWLVVFILFLDLRYIRKSIGLFAPNMIFWAVFMALFITAALQYFNDVKEKDDRRLFAARIANQRDNVMEYLFTDIAERMSRDSLLAEFLQSPSADRRTVINEHLSTNYLRGPLNRFDSRIYIFDRNNRRLFNTDTTAYPYFKTVTELTMPVNRYLYYRENVGDAHYYLAAIPLMIDSMRAGEVFIDITLKKIANESVYPELLQPKIKDDQTEVEYSYGSYTNKRLMIQTNDYPFPAYLKDDTLKEGEYESKYSNNFSELWYKLDNEKTVVIIHEHKLWLESITLFSYLLGVLIVFAAVIFVLRVYFHYLVRENSSERLIHLTLRKRIHLAMLGVVLLSFLIIGGVTIWFFIDRYEATNSNRLQTVMQVLERSIQQYIKNNGASNGVKDFDTETEEPGFRYFINNLANSQNVDINVYNSQGELNTTSQEDIYNRSLLARIMMSDAYYQLSQQRKSLLTQNEQIGKLHYLSCYMPLRNDEGQTLGYINVPFFASQKELNYQISNILVALINLYAFIFLLSSAVAVIITNWLTRTLQIIIAKFEQFSLKGQNELLAWPYDDEIGLLIREYNKMVKKVEENAALLAQSERESAWREMARQVAHEIKNPLTPMKLNIQYLQQALKSDHPQVRQLTENVAESLVEQIDNLSHIASAFSDFAKMPEARPEETELNDLLHKATELYMNSSRLDLDFIREESPINVYADRSQLLRVFTNLLQNSVEAIPEDRKGKIVVELRKDEDHVLITFTDNGSGVPPEVVDRIFSPYFTTKGSGTGLGLAMTKKIIEFWKGSIWFETQAGTGTSFYIRLPLLDD